MTTSTARHARPPQRRLRRHALPLLLGTGTLLAASLAIPTTPAHAFGDGSFAGSLLRGSAHGGTVQLRHASGALVKAGPIASQSLGCNPALGESNYKSSDGATSQLNYLGSITIPIPQSTDLVLRSDTIRNSGYATATDAAAEVFEKSTTQAMNLMQGRITATSVQETAHTKLDADGYHSDAAAVFTDLLLDLDGPGGNDPTPIVLSGPNQRVDLGPLGYAIFDEQIPNATGITANAVHVVVNDLRGFTGDVYVAHVQTEVSVAPARISGFAYASDARLAPLASSGKQALVNLPCNGTGGKDKVRTTGRVIAPGAAAGSRVIDEGATKDTVNAVLSKTSPYSRSTAESEAVKLVVDPDGVARVTADVVRVRAHTYAGYDRLAYALTGTKSWIQGIRSEGSTELVNLVVDGSPIPVDSSTGTTTRIELPGLGYLQVNEQRCSSVAPGGSDGNCSSLVNGTDSHFNQITVTGLHLVVTVPDNAAGLPVGADVRIGVAHSDLAF